MSCDPALRRPRPSLSVVAADPRLHASTTPAVTPRPSRHPGARGAPASAAAHTTGAAAARLRFADDGKTSLNAYFAPARPFCTTVGGMSETNMVRLTKGDMAPNFELESDEYKHYALADFKHQNIVLYFYPKAGSSVCTLEAKQFQDNLERFAKEGYTVIGVSPDDVKELQEFREHNDLGFVLLSDPEYVAHKLYGAAKEHVKDGEKSYETVRSTFVIDGDGKIVFAGYDVDVNGQIDELLEQIK